MSPTERASARLRTIIQYRREISRLEAEISKLASVAADNLRAAEEARDRSERWAKAYNDASAERDRLRQQIKHFQDRTLEQVISEEWGHRGMRVKETFDADKTRWVIELLQESTP